MPLGFMKQILLSDWLPEGVRWADGLNQYPAILTSCLVSKAYILSNNMWSSCYKYFWCQGQPLESVVFDERSPFLFPVTKVLMHSWTFQLEMMKYGNYIYKKKKTKANQFHGWELQKINCVWAYFELVG